jgi:hypothetical protein
MGLFRKMTSVSTLGMVDFKSDKERIANSTRKGMKAQKALLVEMRKANAASQIAPTQVSRVGFVGEHQARQSFRNDQATASQPTATPTAIAAPILSPDGNFWWDGAAWQPMPTRD